SDVSKALVKFGRLKYRCTFLPLDTLRCRETDLKALRIAERLVGKGNVHFAINLITCDPSMERVMKFVFGDTLVCPNIDMAKKVAFAPGVMKRTVTFDGDIFDPSGTLTGGGDNQAEKMLDIIANMKEHKEKMNVLGIQIQQIE